MANINVKDLIRPHLLELSPYSSARSEYTGNEGIFLDANENALGSVGKENFNRYPDPLQRTLKRQISFWRDINIQKIFLGNGSDEAIDLLFRIFCEPGIDRVMVCPPTYGMYEVCAASHKVQVKTVNLTAEYQLDIPAILENLDENVKMIFICSPNNPTGNLINREDIKLLNNSFEGIIVVDEAYHDFTTEPSWLIDLESMNNLIVLQTFSKAWGLAGIRLGMAFADEAIIQIMNNIKMPYNVNTHTQEVALKALEKKREFEDKISRIVEMREELKKELLQIDGILTVYPSEANFLLVKIENASYLFNSLIERQIIIRNRSKVALCEDCLRITIGTKEENLSLLKAIQEILHGK